ncbi:MAG: type IV-A pilus assembly ATPase PilB [Opitutales bacterium]
MALARIQNDIIAHISQYGWLSKEEAKTISSGEKSLTGKDLNTLLMEDFGITRFQILVGTAKVFGLSPFNAEGYRFDESLFKHVSREFCQKTKILPISLVGECLVIAVDDPFSHIENEVAEVSDKKVIKALAFEDDIQRYLESDAQNFIDEEEYKEVVEELDIEYGLEQEIIESEDIESEDSAPIIRLATRIIEDAFYSGGSDIHIEPMEKECRVRVRVDGLCQEKLSLPAKVSNALVARYKIMSNLDIAERRLPQDGRIVFKQFTKRNINIDLRVSTAPLNHGEGLVMRILDKTKSTLPLPALGFEPANLDLYRDVITRPYGMILHCGPTGSGKSMTLYSALNEINRPDVCIRTAEDPIEYTLPGLCQMQMHRKIGLTFASALRAFLRQDPDVILVGEIRDVETASIAVEAALTGHLLFSTLHTNDAPSAIARLTEMGIEPFMISASLILVCAQRLMRRVCKNCRQSYNPETRESDILKQAIEWTGPIYRAKKSGCIACNSQGYKGRVGIHELMRTNESIVKAINAGFETARIKKIAMAYGMKTLHQDSMQKVRAGLTTMEEAIATVPSDVDEILRLKQELAEGVDFLAAD